MGKYIPSSTYRLQLSKSFTFREAISVLPYLKRLGVEMVYLSPFFKTESGSLNPYKISSPDLINEDLGGEEGFERFIKALKKHNLMHMIDLVPNHMGATVENEWWYDVLEKGRESIFADFFDIDWLRGDGKVVLPVLSDSSVMTIENKQLKVDGKYYPLREGSERYDISHAIENQHYKLVHWQQTHKMINYRRFFDISDLVALKIGKKEWYEKYHQTVFKWIKEKKVQGLRVDHPDGIWEVEKYLKRLSSDCKKLDITVEKILQSDESLRTNWPVDGTVGYDALNTLNALFIDSNSKKAFDLLYTTFAKETTPPKKLLSDEKHKYIEKYLNSELFAISNWLADVAGSVGSDYTFKEIKIALVAFLSHFPIYRTYVKEKGMKFDPLDVKAFQTAILDAKLNPRMKQFFSKEIWKKPYRRVLLRIQQLMPAVFAKGFEDTFLYLYNRMIALNEVGSSPTKFGITPHEFHKINETRHKLFPESMITTSTHDTKRSLDVRMRIAVLSEIPDEFSARIYLWRSINGPFIDPNMEYFFYQTLIGFWPDYEPSEMEAKEFEKRLKDYMLKAAKEAKRHTNWFNPNSVYESALTDFITQVLQNQTFWHDFYPFQKRMTRCGELNSLSTLVLKLGMPGIVDFYQGEELFRYDLVDPDNRRDVNFQKREKILNEVLQDVTIEEWFNDLSNSRLRMYILAKGLQMRDLHKELFIYGAYKPVRSQDKDIIAFRRTHKKQELIVKTRRFYTHPHPKEITIEKGFIDIFTNDKITPLPFSIQTNHPF